jgi:hypothetical protein
LCGYRQVEGAQPYGQQGIANQTSIILAAARDIVPRQEGRMNTRKLGIGMVSVLIIALSIVCMSAQGSSRFPALGEYPPHLYWLVAINDQVLPVDVREADGRRLTVDQGSLILKHLLQRPPEWQLSIRAGRHDTYVRDSGVFTAEGDHATFRSLDMGDSFRGKLTGRSLMIQYDVTKDKANPRPHTTFTFERR